MIEGNRREESRRMSLSVSILFTCRVSLYRCLSRILFISVPRSTIFQLVSLCMCVLLSISDVQNPFKSQVDN